VVPRRSLLKTLGLALVPVRILLQYITTAVAALALVGCASPPPRAPLPEALAPQAEVPGIPMARYWADEVPPGFRDWLALPDDVLVARFGGIMDRRHHYLLVSGGGGDGAFGAGLLVGWTSTGRRPEFQIVTGISTGAIIAPFAFLGSAYDPTLRELYTSFGSDDLVRRRGLFEVLRSDSAFSTEPLARLLERYVGDAEIAAIAAEGRKGRSLLIGTTNLDAARPVIWDITQIALSGLPSAKRLIHDVIRASTAIPGAFPPVLIKVEANGLHYDEMHVDGGVTSQLFLGPTGLEWLRIAERLRVEGPAQLYLIRNAKLSPRWEPVSLRLAPILSRTVSSLIRTQGIGDLAQIYLTAERAGMGFNLASVPDDFNLNPSELFDPEYMRALFERGVAAGHDETSWMRPGH
jgi:hypothetical protein